MAGEGSHACVGIAAAVALMAVASAAGAATNHAPQTAR